MERNQREIPRSGEFYRHFKNKLYQIVAVANHSETGEAMVVYQALYGDYKIYVRPLDMFMSPVEKEKYPQAAQSWRFERVSLDAGENSRKQETEAVKTEEAWEQETEDTQVRAPKEPNPDLMQFLEAESLEEKLACFKQMKGRLREEEIDSLYVAMDLTPQEGSLESRLEGLEKSLEMQLKYDGSRLRN